MNQRELMEIEIEQTNGTYFFEIGEVPFREESRILQSLQERFRNRTCRKCGSFLNYYYLYIIKELKKAGLLNKTYKPVCCSCFSKYSRYIIK